MGDAVTIREAVPDDCEDIIRLIHELAEYDNDPTLPRIGADTLRRDGFGEEKMFRCFVADDRNEKHLVGCTMYYFTYSTWEGVNVYMEHLFVTKSHRHRGIGGKLWREVARVAVKRKCNTLNWVCLGWNTHPMEMYIAKGVQNMTVDSDWNVFRMTGETLIHFANSDSGDMKQTNKYFIA